MKEPPLKDSVSRKYTGFCCIVASAAASLGIRNLMLGRRAAGRMVIRIMNGELDISLGSGETERM